MRMLKITPEQADAAYTILCREAGERFTNLERLDAEINRVDRMRDRQAHIPGRWQALTDELDGLVKQRVAMTYELTN